MRSSPPLAQEQTELVALLDDLTSRSDVPGDDRPADVAALRRTLGELGVWTLGVAETRGGGGADATTAALAFSRLGRRWATLAWAAVQAHAAAELLGDPYAELRGAVHTADIAVAVTDNDRIDAAAERPHVLQLTNATLHPPESVTYHPLDRTGLDGALSATIEITGAGAPIDPAGVPGARVRLCAGGAAIAAGLAEAAAEAGISYSAQRQQFGGPLIDLPARIDALAAMAARAAGLVRRAVHPAPMTPWQAAALLGDACESAIDVCADAVQALGGYGYLTEYPVERMLRDAVSLRAATAALAAARNDASELTTK